MYFVRPAPPARVASREILTNTSHRPWPPPTRRWIMKQTWHDLLFIHWPVEPSEIEPITPHGLTLDTFEGVAWIAVVPFWMSGIRLRGLPPIPGTFRFSEINVRTYVRHVDKPGVYFISLDAPQALAIAVARRWFHLNYHRANIQLHHSATDIHYQSQRIGAEPIARFKARYRPIGPPEMASRGTLEHWLTERYCLYATDSRNRLYRAEILHQPWPLQPAEIDVIENTMTFLLSIRLPEMTPLLHYSKRMDTLIWTPEAVATRS